MTLFRIYCMTAMRENKEEFANLHNRLYSKVYSFVNLRVRDKEEAKDIVQDVFLKAYSSWSKVPDEATARNFLYLIARQRMIDLWRSAKHRLQGELSNNSNSDSSLPEYLGEDFDSLESGEKLPEDIFQESENRQKAIELLNKLKPEERELLTLRFLEELEYIELAKIFETSEDNMRQRVSRALQNIRKVANKKNT